MKTDLRQTSRSERTTLELDSCVCPRCDSLAESPEAVDPLRGSLQSEISKLVPQRSPSLLVPAANLVECL